MKRIAGLTQAGPALKLFSTASDAFPGSQAVGQTDHPFDGSRSSRAPLIIAGDLYHAVAAFRRSEPPMIVLEIALIVLALAFFAVMDRYAAGCEKI